MKTAIQGQFSTLMAGNHFNVVDWREIDQINSIAIGINDIYGRAGLPAPPKRAGSAYPHKGSGGGSVLWRPAMAEQRRADEQMSGSGLASLGEAI